MKEYDIDQDCFYAEIEIEAVQKLRSKENFKFVDIPKFNKIRRDLALLVDKNVNYAELYKLAKKNPSKYLKNINLFDVYEGDKLPNGKKSYALSFMIQDENKTLSDQDIDALMQKLIKLYQDKFNAELR